MKKKSLLGMVLLLLGLFLVQGGILYWAQEQQIKDLLEEFSPLLERLEPAKVQETLRHQHRKRLFQIALFDRELNLIAGSLSWENWELHQDLLFARAHQARVFNFLKGYEIFPLKDYLLVVCFKDLGLRYFIAFWWPEWPFLFLVLMAFFTWWHRKGGHVRGALHLCQAFLQKFLDLKEELPLEETLVQAGKKIQDLQQSNLKKEKKIEALEQEVHGLKRSLRKTLQDLESTQQSLLQAGSLMALGEFAAGISHELNNPLGIVLGFTQYLLDEVPPDHPHHTKLKRMETELERAQKIIQDLLAFARPAEPRRQWVDVNQLIKETLQLLLYSPVPSVQVECRLAEGLPPAHLDPDQLEQVLVNLFKNALEAMPEGGILRVETHLTTLDPKDCFELSLPLAHPSALLMDRDHDPSKRLPKVKQVYEPGDPAIRIDISDTGIGIAKKNLPKIFTPFFTTKKRGTGLGLSICWKLIRRNGGLLRVQSVPGEGTTFSIILPVKEPQDVSPRQDIDR